MRRRTSVLLSLLAGSIASAQDAPKAESAAALLERLREAGVEIPEGFTANEDGSVSLPALPAPPEGEAEAAEGETPDGGVPGATATEVTPVEWDTNLNLGLNVSQGNTEQLGFAATIVSKRLAESSELTLDAGYFFGSEDGEQTENRFTAGVLHDWIFPGSRWIAFADARYDFDEFRSFDHRISSHGGVGYEVIKKENLSLTLRAGGGFAREFGSERNEIIPEALLGGDLSWQIAENQSLEASHRFFPDLIETGEFRTLSTLGWKLDIDRMDGVSFTINGIHEYVSDVDEGVDNSDLKLFAGLSLDF